MHARVLIEFRRLICAGCPTPCERREAGDDFFGEGCSSCPIGRWVPWECGKPLAPAPEPPLPPLLTRGKNFALAAIDESLAWLRGRPKTLEEVAEDRRRVCRSNACGQFRPSDESCAACGCPVARKTPWRSATCPRGKWRV